MSAEGTRADLLALGPEALAALANLGLVKRAQRELAAGVVPTIAIEDDGTVVGTFADGVCARLPPGARLEACPCTCKASGVCRHRIAVVLAYRETANATDVARAAEPTSTDDDAVLRQHLGAKIFAAAVGMRGRGVVVTVEGDAVHLPTCSVRFLVGDAPEYARCDCATSGPCEHLALAIWARRTAAGTFELGGDPDRRAALDPADSRELEALVAAILDDGVLAPPERLAERFAILRSRHGTATWIVATLDDVQRQLEAYAARTARYDEAELVRLLTELAARARAARHPDAALPPRYVLGVGEAQQTALEQLRLVSMGARVFADGDARWAHVYLADPDAGSVLVLETQWTKDGDDTPEAIARRSVAPGIGLGALAHGQVVTRAAKRRANLGLVLGSRRGTTALLPGTGDRSALPPSLYVRDFEVLRRRLVARPPQALRPRVLAEGLVALAIARVDAVAYLPATQTLHATVRDVDGVEAHVQLAHRAIAPHALDALAAGLRGGARTIVGRVQVAHGGLLLSPVAVEGEATGFCVLDLAGPTAAPPVDRAVASRRADAIEDALEMVAGVLARLVHHGLRRGVVGARVDLDRTAAACERVGLMGLGASLRELARRPNPAAWIDAAILHALS